MRKSWYRGTSPKENPLRKHWTYWTPTRHYAENIAYRKNGTLFRMQIAEIPDPKQVFYGGDVGVLRKFHLMRKYRKLIRQNKDRQAENLAHKELRKRGYRARVIDKDQIIIYDPKLINIKSKRRIYR